MIIRPDKTPFYRKSGSNGCRAAVRIARILDGGKAMGALVLIAVLLGCNSQLALSVRSETGPGAVRTGDSTTSGGAARGTTCTGGASPQLAITKARVVDANGNGMFEPGERVAVE